MAQRGLQIRFRFWIDAAHVVGFVGEDMRTLFLILPAVFALMMTSCFEHHVSIRLNKDGSGTVTEETVLGAQTVAMLEQMSAMGGGGGGAPDPLGDMTDPDKAAATAKKMGKGVTVQKVEKINEGGRKGSRIIYAFADINDLSYRFGESLSDMGGNMAQAKIEDEEPPMRFKYADGQLSFENPGSGNAENAAIDQEAGEPGPGELEQAKKMMGDLKMSITMAFPGGIAATNASHRDGDTITLLEMNMGELLAQPGVFAKLQKANPESPAEMSKLLEGVEGMKVEAEETVRVSLK
jgi:hypothetical protein